MKRREKLTAPELIKWKRKGRKIPVLTCYDFSFARILDAAEIPVLLVGDSLGQVVLGYETTLPVTVDDMIHHTRAVVRGTSRALVVADMPFMSYQASVGDAVRSAGRLVQEGRADAVKLEGGARTLDAVKAIVETGIPVMGHLGLTPQSILAFGGYRVQGKLKSEAARLIKDAVALSEAGCFAIVLEMIPAPLAREVSVEIPIPTIGIGAGPDCDGQVLVVHDLLGLFTEFTPKFVRRFMEGSAEITGAVRTFAEAVETGEYPGPEHCYGMDEGREAR